MAIYILVDAGVLLRKGLKPHYIACRGTHDQIEMVWSFREEVDIMTQDVSLGEKDLDNMLRLAVISDMRLPRPHYDDLLWSRCWMISPTTEKLD